MGVWSLWRGLISRKLGLSVVFWCYCFVGWVNGWVFWLVDGWAGWCMYGCDCMHGRLGYALMGVLSLCRGLISRKLVLSVVFFVGLVNGWVCWWVDGWAGC